MSIHPASAEDVTFDDNVTWTCNQYFAPIVLRYNYYYGFFDTFNNPNASNFTAYMNTYAVKFRGGNYLRM
jgi:hypothetical protein